MNQRLMSCPVFLLSFLLIGGCYSFQPPAPPLLGTKFTSANRDATDRMLNKMNVLTLEDAKHIAQLNNQNYIAAYHSVNAARMRYYQALGSYAPEIHAGTSVGQNLMWNNNLTNPPEPHAAGRDFAFSNNNTVTASWLLFDGFARYLTVKAKESEWKKENAIQYRVLCMLRRAVAYAYYDIQFAREIERIQRENIKFQNELYQIVQPEWKQKKRPEDEVINFRYLAGVGETGLLNAQYQRDVASYSLSQLMGYGEGRLPADIAVNPYADDIRPMYYSVDMCLDIAFANSPEMHIMQQLLKIAEYNKYKSYSTYFPVVYALAGYGNSQMRQQYRGFTADRSTYSSNEFNYGIRADLLVFDGFARYNSMREMQALFAAAEFNMAEMYLQIMNGIRSAYANYENNLKQVKIYRTLLQEALLQRNLVTDRYKRYDTSVDRLDKVQAYYVDTQIQYAQVVTDFKKAVAQLEAIMCIDVYAKVRE